MALITDAPSETNVLGRTVTSSDQNLLIFRAVISSASADRYLRPVDSIR